jgi:hypothetical protein
VHRKASANPLNRATLSWRMDRLFPSVACLPFAATLLGLGGAPAVHAATIVVTSTADAGDVGTCTLRQAIVSMNTGAATGNCANNGAAFGSNDTINFTGDLFSDGVAAITLAYSLHITDNNLVIDAGTGRNVTVQRPAGAQNPFPIIGAELDGGNLLLSGLTVQNGYATYERGLNKYSRGFFDAAGGGILFHDGSLTLDHCTIRNNTVKDTAYAYGNAVAPAVGGGIAVLAGHLTMTSTLVTGNTAKGKFGMGGGIYLAKASLMMVDSTISGNVAEGIIFGGAAVLSSVGNPLHAIYPASIGITNSTISGNTSPNASQGGGAVVALLPSSVTLLNSTLACNDSAGRAPDGHPIPALYIGDPPNSSRFSAISTIFADTANSRCATRTSTEWGSYGTSSPPVSSPITLSGDHNLIVSSSATQQQRAASCRYHQSRSAARPLAGQRRPGAYARIGRWQPGAGCGQQSGQPALRPAWSGLRPFRRWRARHRRIRRPDQ